MQPRPASKGTNVGNEGQTRQALPCLAYDFGIFVVKARCAERDHCARSVTPTCAALRWSAPPRSRTTPCNCGWPVAARTSHCNPLRVRDAPALVRFRSPALRKRKTQLLTLKPAKTADFGTCTVKRPTENRERKTAESAPGTATSQGARSRGRCPKPRQHRGNGQKKSQPDKGWDFTLWWSWREPKDYTPPESTIYFFVKNQWLNGIENFTRDTLALGCHPKMWSQVYLFLAFLGRLTFADAGSIPHFSMLPANSAFCTAPTPSNAAQKTR